jgi:hypothetical protein
MYSLTDARGVRRSSSSFDLFRLYLDDQCMASSNPFADALGALHNVLL